MAFVTAYSYPNSDIKYSGTWVRTCPDFWKFTNAEKTTAGFVLYHELVHVVSTVGDGYGGYSKSSGVQLAYDEPIKARLTANNYMLYAMQNSMTPYNYAAATSDWGGSVLNLECKDNFANCYKMIESDCCNPANGEGSWLEGQCCATCSVKNASAKCQTQLQ